MVKCLNVQDNLQVGETQNFWFKFAFTSTTSITGTVKFYDSENHELANFALAAVETIENNDNGGKLVFNDNTGEYVQTWDPLSDLKRCGPLGIDSTTDLQW